MPAGVETAVATVRVDVVPGVMLVGLNEQVEFVGQPESTVRFTVPLYPLIAVSLMVDVADWPGLIVAVVGLAATEKSRTETVNVAVCVRAEFTLSVPCAVTI